MSSNRRAGSAVSAPAAARGPASPLASIAAAGIIALVAYLVFRPEFLGYDLYYALDWGDDVLGGRTPQYDVAFAPTPHPLSILAGMLLSPLGFGAEPAMHALVLVGFGALCVGVYRLGAELYTWHVGLLAAAIVATREPILFFSTRPSIDVPFAAMVVWAAVLEARRPRRGVPVLVLLSLAGLLRPEGWFFAAAYWVWLAWPLPWAGRIRLAALAASAPLLWMFSDLLVTGDLLWSFHSAESGGAATYGLPGDPPGGVVTGHGVFVIGHAAGPVVEDLARSLGGILRAPELIAAAGGFAAGLVWLRRRPLLPAAIAVVNGAVFTAFGIGDVLTANRFLFSAAAMLALLAAVAALGWLTLDRGHPARVRWQVAGAAVLAVFLAFTPAQAGRLQDLRDVIDDQDGVRAELRDLVRLPAAESALSHDCGPIYVPNHSFVPQIAYWSDVRPSDLSSLRARPITRPGVLITGTTSAVEEHAFSAQTEPVRFETPAPPPAYRLVASNRSWRLYTACPAPS